MDLLVRNAEQNDFNSILGLINELAIYEKAPEQVIVTVKQLQNDYREGMFNCFVGVLDEEIIGIAFYYYKYSTWKGRCLYLEDLVVSEKHRRKQIGKKLFDAVIQKSKSEKVERMEWQVLDWNKPAIEFYKKYNAELDPEWLNGRFYKNDLDKIL